MIRRRIRTKHIVTYIYGLLDPRDNQIKYIGKTTRNVNVRLKEHFKDCKRDKTHKKFWLDSLLVQNIMPEILILETTNDLNWQELEIWWISYFKYLGANITNSTDGGDGVANHSKETKNKISELHKGRIKSDETRLKLSKALTGRIMSDEWRKKLSDAKKGKASPHKGRKHTGQALQNIRNGKVGYKPTTNLQDYFPNGFSGVNNPFYGKTHTKETINKISTKSKEQYKQREKDSFGRFI